MLRAAYFDVDGTLVSFRTHAVPDDTLQALRMLRAAGVKCILCTGRNGDTARPLMETGLFDGQILVNGQRCEIDGQVILSCPVSKEDIAIAVAGAESGEFVLDFAADYENFMNRVDEYVIAADEAGGMPPIRVLPAKTALDMDIYQMHFYGPPGSEDALTSRAQNLTSSRWSQYFADVYPLGGGKERGMAAINAHLGLTADEAIAFGDGENDMGMLRAAGVGVAMGNASATVQGVADYVTASVDDGGILKAVEHFAAELGLSFQRGEPL